MIFEERLHLKASHFNHVYLVLYGCYIHIILIVQIFTVLQRQQKILPRINIVTVLIQKSGLCNPSHKIMSLFRITSSMFVISFKYHCNCQHI